MGRKWEGARGHAKMPFLAPSVCPSHFARAGGLARRSAPEPERSPPSLACSNILLLHCLHTPTWVSSSPLEAKTNFHGNGRNQFGVRHREKTRAHDGTSERGRAPFVERQKKANHSQAPCPDSQRGGRKVVQHGRGIHPFGVQAEWACVRNRSSLHDNYYAAEIRRQATERMKEREREHVR